MGKQKNYLVFTVIPFLLIFFLFGLSTAVTAIDIEYGNRGKIVREVQNYLSHLGYDIIVDGIYGYRTREVVKDFQYNNGLKVDGVVGNNTYERLKKATKDIKYEVKKGDTLYDIARKYDSTIEDIKRRNNLKTNKIVIGQILYIPKTGIGGGEEGRISATIIHKVRPGDALSILARKYGSEVETIKLANNLHSDRIYVGQQLVIPHLKSPGNRPFKLQKGALIWPVLGRISSNYGWRIHPVSDKEEFHHGLDIAVPIGTEIRAAAAGKIVQCGWRGGFGKTVVINHGQGVKTLYGHNSRLLVPAGSRVNVGEVIALAGSTGTSTGSHLHFGLIVNDKAINPLRYLP